MESLKEVTHQVEERHYDQDGERRKNQMASERGQSGDRSRALIPSNRLFPRMRHTLNRYWAPELILMFLSFAATIAIAALLFAFHNRPLQSWPYHRITINTAISLLNVVAKACMLFAVVQALSQLKWLWFHRCQGRTLNDLQIFDNATRGPFGALQLLFQVTRSSLGSIGAMVIILSIALDPFFQQLLTFPERAVTVARPLAGRLLDLDIENTEVERWDNKNGTLYPNVVGFLPPLALRSAIFGGTFRSPPQLNLDCPTGNCTWPIFSSLAFCSRCQTSKGRVKMNEDHSVAEYVSTSNISWKVPTRHTPIPSNIGLLLGSSNTNHSVVGVNYPIFGFAHFPQVSIRVNNDNGLSKPIDDRWAPEQECTECALVFCVKRFKADVVNGQQNVTVVSRIENNTAMSGFMGMIADGQDLFSWRSAISNFFYFQFPQPWNDSNVYLDERNERWYTDLHLQWSLTDNIVQTMDDMATGMTNALMNNYSTPGAAQAGVAHLNETYIQVRWPWLVLPALLTLSAFAFIILVMIESSGHENMLWKSSLLPLFFQHLEVDEAKVPVSSSTSEMDRSARSITARLVLDREDSWGFSESRIDEIKST